MAVMRVAQVSHATGPLEIVERPIPEPSPGWVRIKVQACGICHTDSVTKEGLFPGIQYPRVPGHEVAGVIDAIGPGVKLMADANQGLNEAQAIRLGRMLEPFDLTWFEEPLPAWDLEGLARVSAALDTPIASGETEYTRYGFRRMLELRSADILMPDLQRVGGVSEFMRVSHMAESHDVPVSSHLFPETSIQVLGALANAIYLEYMPWFSKLYHEELAFKDGNAIVPERPGWGFTFNRDYVRHLNQ